MSFIPLTTIEQWEKLLSDSQNSPAIIFKHSAICGTSAYAHEILKDGFESGSLIVPVHILVVQESRDISNSIAETLQVRHESPQILVISKGKCIYHNSHHGIKPELIMKAVAGTK